MKLLSAADAINFLGKSAPRPWVKRMLKWMIYEGELNPYFTNGKITPFTSVLGVLLQVEGLAQRDAGPERDAEIRASFDEGIAKQLVGRANMEPVFDEPTEWDETEAPHQVSAGFFIYAEDLDWEAGTIKAEIYAPDSREAYIFWDADEHLGSQFDRAEYKVELSGLRFPLDAIEMLLPNAELNASESTRGSIYREPIIGRPRKWDWEGAFARLAVVAQHPDGLPTGPGAQARIEKILADWFVTETGDSPASSQIRQRAQKMTRLLSVPKT
jgi:hypothetical protein